ncbi:MAG TPA: SGNH/GDSL hydrolase family protein [Gemmataceae bacterium]|jgi:lysophospholipase L1-like esterase|nr:SGNH/GDSL hydrolase family protein [Gemmataceae bacterium]
MAVKLPATLISLLGYLGIALGSAADLELPVAVKPTDPNIRYVGRFDNSAPAGPSCAWSNSAVHLRFKGTALSVKLAENSENHWQVVIDGKPTSVIKSKGPGAVYPIATGLAEGEHSVELVRRTEAFAGKTQLLGFQLNAGGKLLPVPTPSRRIEVIGDSISCGYGSEGKSEHEHFTLNTENAYETYGAIAARELGAEYVCIAWSGKKMWPDNTIPSIYDRTLPEDAKSQWDFSKWIPDVVLINLATNDFGQKVPDEKGWTDAYKSFLDRVRKNYPNAEIYVASGSMMGDSGENKQLSTLKKYLAKIVADRRAAGDAKVHEIDFAMQNRKDGLGSDWHPSIKTHQIMAKKLVETLRQDLGWKP